MNCIYVSNRNDLIKQLKKEDLYFKLLLDWGDPKKLSFDDILTYLRLNSKNWYEKE